MNLWNYMLFFSLFLFLLGTLSPRRGEEECCSPGSCWWWSHWGTTSPETPSTGFYTFLRGGPGNQSSYLSDSPPNSPPPHPQPPTHPPTHLPKTLGTRGKCKDTKVFIQILYVFKGVYLKFKYVRVLND